MKINLSKEQLERVCELVDEYEWNHGSLWIEGKFVLDPHVDILYKHTGASYRDFLQLVIEAIEEELDIRLAIWKHFGDNDYHWAWEGESDARAETRTEAKENAIIYALEDLVAK